MQSSASAQQALRQYDIPLWASEEFSTFSDETGALCWIRIVVDDYVTGNMTMTSSWYLVSGSYPSIPFWSEGMLTASEPWAGSYRINPQVCTPLRVTRATDALLPLTLGHFGKTHWTHAGLGDSALYTVHHAGRSISSPRCRHRQATTRRKLR